MLWKCCTQQWPQDWKRSVLIPKKGKAKEYTNYCIIALISQASKVMLKILQARFQRYMNSKLPNVQAGFRKGREPEIKLPTSSGLSKKQESSRKTSTFALLTMPKPLTVWITTNCEKFFKRWEYQTTWSASWEICMQVRNQQLDLDMEQQTDSKLGKEYIKAVYCYPAYLTYIQNAGLDEVQAGIKIGREISITSDIQMTPHLWHKVKKSWRASWWNWKRRVKRLA